MPLQAAGDSAWEALADILMDICRAKPHATFDLNQIRRSAIMHKSHSQQQQEQQAKEKPSNKLTAPFAALAKWSKRVFSEAPQQPADFKAPDPGHFIPAQHAGVPPLHPHPAIPTDNGPPHVSSPTSGDLTMKPVLPVPFVNAAEDQLLHNPAQSDMKSTMPRPVHELQSSWQRPHVGVPGPGM